MVSDENKDYGQENFSGDVMNDKNERSQEEQGAVEQNPVVQEQIEQNEPEQTANEQFVQGQNQYDNWTAMTDGQNGNQGSSYGGALGEPPAPKKKNRGIRAALITAGAVVGIAIIGFSIVGAKSLIENTLLGGGGTSTIDKVINPNGPSMKLNNIPTTASSSAMNAQSVYKAVKDSIVTIRVYSQQSVEPDSEGSGIVLSSDGYIITNEHVVDGAQSIQVVMSDNKQYSAKLVGSDLRTDLAVLKVEATDLQAATFGNSDQLKVAQSVLAIGNPGGLQFSGSVTQGIISATSRSITTESGYSENCIQTDTAINPGNSGGALVNLYGQIIGITSSKIAEEGYEGMGFAIPINTAQPVVNDIIKYGYVTGRVKIGISVAEYDANRAQALGYPQGLLIAAVDSSSDAAAKGIKANDIITKFNGVAVSSIAQLSAETSKFKPGNTVKVTIYRYSTKSTFEVSITLAEDKGAVSSSSAENGQNSQNGDIFGNGGSGDYGYNYGNGNGNGSGSYGYNGGRSGGSSGSSGSGAYGGYTT